ncbi:MAG: Mrp/NBP35 family ATP-binding protein, partial [Halobacteriales archaeon]
MDAATVRERLRDLEDPDLGGRLLDRGLLEVVDRDGSAVVEVRLGAIGSPTEAALLAAVDAAVEDLDVAVERVAPGGTDEVGAVLDGVSNVVAVASGKGGVGKTSVAVNLAVGLADRGAAVGLFDADVYGPNAPMAVGEHGPPSATPEETLVPPTAHGVRVMSMAYLVGEQDPVIWRGPMVHKVITQLVEDVEWGALDYLVVDLPPGTGDTQLTLLQTVPLTGAVIVTTPQRVALHDARKGLEMFGRHETAVLGIVENMAGFRCPDCGSIHDVFGAGGGRALAEEVDLPFLGSVPLDPR